VTDAHYANKISMAPQPMTAGSIETTVKYRLLC